MSVSPGVCTIFETSERSVERGTPPGRQCSQRELFRSRETSLENLCPGGPHRCVLRLEVLKNIDGVLGDGVDFHARHLDDIHVVAEETLHLPERSRLHVPDARQIRCAIRGARGAGRQNRPAVWRARRAGCRMFHPLCIHCLSDDREKNQDGGSTHIPDFHFWPTAMSPLYTTGGEGQQPLLPFPNQNLSSRTTYALPPEVAHVTIRRFFITEPLEKACC